MLNEQELLESIENKLQQVRDRVQGVAEGYINGFFLWGEGGTSKSYTVEEALQTLGRQYKLTNSRLTGKGLFELLRDYPDVVHVLEDVETLFSDKNSFGVLRSALWGQAGEDGIQERPVVWQVSGRRDEFIFTGGIVLIANCRLDDIPQLRALKTRIVTMHYQPTNEEVAVLMTQIAKRGHRHGPFSLSSEECLEVAQAIIARSKRLQRNLDLRLLVNTCKDRLQWANGASQTHWLDLLDSRMKERAVPLGSRAGQKAQEVEIASRIAGMPFQERLDTWIRETGKSQAALYRRLEDAKRSSSQFFSLSGPCDLDVVGSGEK